MQAATELFREANAHEIGSHSSDNGPEVLESWIKPITDRFMEFDNEATSRPLEQDELVALTELNREMTAAVLRIKKTIAAIREFEGLSSVQTM